jgi:hypothetical protein
MAIPKAEFIGLSSADPDAYGLPRNVDINLNDKDISQAKELLKRMLASGFKYELDALANKDFRYLTKTYLPRKLKEEDWLDSRESSDFGVLKRTGRTNAVPSAPSPRDAGGRNAASPAGPNLTRGIARVTGAKTSVSTAIALCPGPSCAATGSRSRSGRRGAAAGPGGRRRVSGAASREGLRRGLRECGGGRWGGAGRRGGCPRTRAR